MRLAYVADRLLANATSGIRAARYRRKTAPFIFKGEHRLLFELHPGEEIDRHIATYGIYERKLLRYIETLVPSGGTVVDIGANIGNHALFLSRKAGVVHCFEPNPRAYQRLERNIALNDISNIIVHQHGIGSENAVRHFHDESDGNLGMSRYSPDGELELEVRRGDDVISLDRVDLIKIDVEGMEADVLCGLRRSIRKYRPVVVFEYNGGDWQTIVESLPGYSISEPVFAPLNPSPKLKRVTERPERWVECLIGKSDSSDSNGTA